MCCTGRPPGTECSTQPSDCPQRQKDTTALSGGGELSLRDKLYLGAGVVYGLAASTCLGYDLIVGGILCAIASAACFSAGVTPSHD